MPSQEDEDPIAAPGRHQLMFGWVTVTAEDMEIWARYPDATFALYETAVANEILTDWTMGIDSAKW